MIACRAPDGKISDVLPGKDSGFNARTRVHEYGGGETIVGDGAVYWSNFKCASNAPCIQAAIPSSLVTDRRHNQKLNSAAV